MATPNSRIPHIIEPYTRQAPDQALTLITGVLDATPYWLVTQFIAAALAFRDADGGRTAVVLVSWMRDLEYWRNDIKKSTGTELSRLRDEQQIRFVDGLATLYGSDKSATTPLAVQTRATASTTPLQTSTLPHRGPPASGSRAQPPSPVASSARPSTGHHLLDAARQTINAEIEALQKDTRNTRVVLVVDSPTVLMATTSVTPTQLSRFVLGLRQLVHSAIVVSEADGPLISAAVPGAFEDSASGSSNARVTPLEADHAAFVVGQAHQAGLVLSTRPLDTGVARDVSGVLQIARGAGWDPELDGEARHDTGRQAAAPASGQEVLYHILTDGKVSVFERGSRNVG